MTLLAQAGEALYGPRWQSEVARVLDVNIRTVQRWASGNTSVPPGVFVELRKLVKTRANVLISLNRRLLKAATLTEKQ